MKSKKKGGDYKFKITPILTAGLGNRLFTIAAGLGYAEKWDMEFFLNQIPGDNQNHVPVEESYNDINTLLPNLQYLEPTIDISTWIRLNEEKENFAKYVQFDKPNNNTVISGYFQTQKYFPKEFKLTLNEPTEGNLIKSVDVNNLFFIHMRLGDYSNGVSIRVEEYKLYYNKCISTILEKNPNAIFIVLSKDIDSVKKAISSNYNNILNDSNTIYDDNKSRLNSLYYMSKSKGGICMSSTFSWWGAYSIEHKNKDLIFFPTPWFINTSDTDILPEWATLIDLTNIIQTAGKYITKIGMMKNTRKRRYKKYLRKSKKYLRKSKGGSNSEIKNRELILRRSEGSGFFSNFNKMMTYLVDNQNIVKITFDLKSTSAGNSLPFGAENTELLSTLFDNYDEGKSIDETVVAESPASWRITYTEAYNFYNENRNKLQPFHDAFVKYIKLKQPLKERLSTMIQQMRGDAAQVVGIFVRSNSLVYEQPAKVMPTREEYAAAINNIDTSKPTRYFIRADNDDDMQYYSNLYKPNFSTQIKRSKTNQNDAMHRNSGATMTLQDLEDIYLEVALLSNCDILVHCVSNMATASLYMNMNQKSICVSKPAPSSTGGWKRKL